MGETADQIEQRIQEQRNELGENINELQQKVKDTFDWRAQFEERPLAMMGIAVGSGLLLSALIGGRSHSSNLKGSAVQQRLVSQNDEPRRSYSGNGSSTKPSEAWRDVKGALVGVAAARLGTLLDSFIPGFSEEYNKAKRSDGSVQLGGRL